MNTVRINHWRIITSMSVAGDYLSLYGMLDGHPKFDGQFAIPGTFTSFNRNDRTAVSISGKKYVFGRFNPTGNAKTEDDAFDWIEKNWIKK